MYNPKTVVLALSNNNLGNYWINSGPYDELFYYIGANVDEVKEDAAGAVLTADIIGREYRKGAVIYTASPVH